MVIFMAGVAHQTSTIAQSSKSNHVNYTERYIIGFDPVSGFPYYGTATWYSAARINGSVGASSPNVFVNGQPLAHVDSPTPETWVADPTPYPHYGGSIISISPGSSGSGNGRISMGNNKNVFVNGKSVAVIGSQVTTHLSTTTTVSSGSSNVTIG